MSKTTIYYFSGTGNSLYVAKEMQNKIPEAELIPMLSVLNNLVIKTHSETVGFVFPIYLTSIPIPVKEFIKKLDLKSTKYIFAIATRIGTSHSAFNCIEKILKKKDKKLNAYFSINMASNDPKFNYKKPADEKLKEIELNVNNDLASIVKVINNKQKSREKDANVITKIPFVGAISMLADLMNGFEQNMYADSKCKGCGTCEKVCLSGKIKIIDRKPTWQKNIKCYHCAACLNFCPMQAVQIKNMTEKNERYSHPYASIEDIVGQKP